MHSHECLLVAVVTTVRQCLSTFFAAAEPYISVKITHGTPWHAMICEFNSIGKVEFSGCLGTDVPSRVERQKTCVSLEQNPQTLTIKQQAKDLEYGNVVWQPFLKQDIELIEGVQYQATRMVLGLAKLTYEERLKKMDLPSLAYRRVRGDAIELHKYLHGIYSVDSSDLLPLHESSSLSTRGHTLKLAKRSSRTRSVMTKLL